MHPVGTESCLQSLRLADVVSIAGAIRYSRTWRPARRGLICPALRVRMELQATMHTFAPFPISALNDV